MNSGGVAAAVSAANSGTEGEARRPNKLERMSQTFKIISAVTALCDP